MAKKTRKELLAEHRHWLRYWLNQARLNVKDRDWLRASDCYGSAAYHKRLLQIWNAK